MTEAERRSVEELVPLARMLLDIFLAGRPHLRPYRDDIESFAHEALCVAVQRYRPGAASLRTMARRRLDGAFLDAVRRNFGRAGSSRASVRTHVGLDAFAPRLAATDRPVSPSGGIDLLAESERILGPRLAAIVVGHSAYGRTYPDLADDLGLPARLVQSLHREGLERLRQALAG